MALSRITKIATGASNTFAVDFALGYGREQDVTARVGDEVDGLGAPAYRTIDFSVAGVMTISGALAPAGTEVVFERTVDRDELSVDWADGANITGDNMDKAQLQALRLVHEALDGRFEEITQDINMQGHTVTNLAAPVNDSDAVTKEYADNRIDAELPGVLAAAQAAAGTATTMAGTATTQAGIAATKAQEAGELRDEAEEQVTLATAKAGEAAASAATVAGAVDQIGTALQPEDITDDDDLAVDGDKLPLRSNVKAYVDANAGGAAPDVLNSWMQGKSPKIITRAQPKFLTPEMYIGLETQIIYCPAGEPGNYSGATDFKPAFDAMRAEMLSLRLAQEWPPSSTNPFYRFPFGIALQPGHRYALDSGVNFTRLRTDGMVFNGNGGSLVARYAGGAPVLDLIGAAGWTVNSLRIESDNSAQPSFACLIGRPEVLWGATDMQFNDCYFDGWFQKAVMGNYAAEVSGWRGGALMSYNTVPAYWLDSRNAMNIGAHTQATGVTVSVGTDASAIMHSFERTNIRCIQGTPTGAFRMTSGLAPSEHNALRKVRLENVYLTNNGNNASALKPAVVVQGIVNDLYLDIHGELKVDDANIQLSHLVYYDTSLGEQKQHGHTIIEHLSDAEIAVIGKSDDANMLYISDADIRVYAARGKDTGLVDADLFSSNMATQARIAGRIAVGADVDLLDLTDLQCFSGDLLTNSIWTGTNIRGNSPVRFISPNEPYGGFRKLSQKSAAAGGAIDVENAELIDVTGATAANFTAGNTYPHVFTVVNTHATNTVTISGLAGPNVTIAAKTARRFLSYAGVFYAA